MRKEAAIKLIKKHISGSINKTASFILKEIENEIIKAGGMPPLKVIKVSQMAEELEESLNSELQDVAPETEGENIMDSLDGDSDESEEQIIGNSGPASYSISRNVIELSNYDNSDGIIANKIVLQPDQDQISILLKNVQNDGDTVLGNVTIHSPDDQEQPQIAVPSGYNGTVSFNLISRENGIATDEVIYGFYSM